MCQRAMCYRPSKEAIIKEFLGKEWFMNNDLLTKGDSL